jgi:hypothetical protein
MRGRGDSNKSHFTTRREGREGFQIVHRGGAEDTEGEFQIKNLCVLYGSAVNPVFGRASTAWITPVGLIVVIILGAA